MGLLASAAGVLAGALAVGGFLAPRGKGTDPDGGRSADATAALASAADTTPPTIEVTDPPGEAVSTYSTQDVTVRGRATDANLHQVRLDGRPLVDVSADGTFLAVISLAEEESRTLVFDATDEAGNTSAKVARRVQRERPSRAAPSPPPAPAWKEPLEAAKAAGREKDWEKAGTLLEEARGQDAPKVEIPAWLEDGVSAYRVPPVLTVTSPADGATVREAKVAVSWTLSTGRASDAVYVNGSKAVSGSVVGLVEGANAIEAEVRDGKGVPRGVGRTISVNYVKDPPPRESAVPSWAKVSAEQVAEAKGLGVAVAFENAIGIKFVLVPSGTFSTGSPETEAGRSGDETQHQVTFTKAHYLSIHETTNGQYRRFESDHASWANFDGDAQPVVNVSHDDATAFASWVNGQDPGHEYRLPTEAEWEHACRAGTTTPFSFGATITPGQATYDGDYAYGTGPKSEDRQKTTPVGSFAANAYGLYDMHGNVYEWCADWYGAYPAGSGTDPKGPASGAARVLRGGSWFSLPGDLRSANRFGVAPVARNVYFGFRLAVSVSAPR